jgi:phospholipase A1
MPLRRFRPLSLAAALAALGFAGALPAAASMPAGLDACTSIADDAARLRCFDAFVQAQRSAAPADASAAATVPAPQHATPPASVAAAAPLPVTPMSDRWELEPDSKRGLWSFRPHKPNYILLGRYTDSVNMEPYDRYFQAVGDPNLGLDDTEAKFQLSFKLKALENILGSDADLWFGYTQQNQWQVYNSDISSPFRETNYEPEVFVTLPVHYDLLGLTGRFVNLGFVHQSNGQTANLSRSWNRVYAQFGFEYGNRFNLLFKPWHRIEEDAADDDNPDITDYMGDFELVASYRTGRHTFTALGRSGFEFERGFLQLDWSYALYQSLRTYVQATTGYGESLIDYNHDQNTIGFGIMLTDWM